jgi:glycosyltransferase involved in cell wall biosynthesis
MRIGFYAPLKAPNHPAPSGDRRMARLLIQALEGMGHEVQLLSELRSYNRDGDPILEQQIANEAAQNIDRIAQAWHREPQQRPDLLFTYHVYHKAADYIGPGLKAVFSLPYVIAEPSIAPKRQVGPWSAGYAQAAAAFEAADLLLPITTLDGACLAAFAWAPKLHPLAPFLDPAPFAAAAAHRADCRGAAARRHGLPADQPWLLAVGMARPGDKIASFRRLAETLAISTQFPWHMIIVGDGPELPALKSAFGAVQKRTSFTGRLEGDELIGLYAAADIYVWPAINEAYGMALLEAQAAGLPVLSVNTRGVPDIVRDQETGILTADDSAAGISDALGRLLRNPAQREAMSQSAKAHVARNLSMTAAQERLAAAFIRLGLPS